jgi:hypothetical protein
MAVGAWIFYNRAKRNIGQGTFPLTTAAAKFRMTLHLSASNAATPTLSTYGSVTSQVAAAAGYTTSGKTFNNTLTAGASAGQYRFNTTSIGVFWSANAGTITGIKFAVIWCSGASATVKKLLCYSQLSTAAFNLAAGNRLTITPAATGIFNMA